MDAFPDYTRFDNTKKVLAAIQIMATTSSETELTRGLTPTKRVQDPSTDRIVESEENDSVNKETPRSKDGKNNRYVVEGE